MSAEHDGYTDPTDNVDRDAELEVVERRSDDEKDNVYDNRQTQEPPARLIERASL